MDIAVNGAAGAMGRRMVSLIAGAEDCRLVAALEREGHPQLGTDAGSLAGVRALGVPLSASFDVPAHVLVDFSSPEAAIACARRCAEKGLAVVIGTTGLSAEQMKEIQRDVASRVPVLVSPNMSVGVNLLFELAGQVARALGKGYDIEILEAHHRRKKDAPSGTAKELARRLCEALGRGPGVLRYGREGIVGERPADEIAIHAVRGGDIVGDHTVIFAGEGERLELTHRASSRDVFAHGALRAARFVAGRRPGLYCMADALA